MSPQYLPSDLRECCSYQYYLMSTNEMHGKLLLISKQICTSFNTEHSIFPVSISLSRRVPRRLCTAFTSFSRSLCCPYECEPRKHRLRWSQFFFPGKQAHGYPFEADSECFLLPPQRFSETLLHTGVC